MRFDQKIKLKLVLSNKNKNFLSVHEALPCFVVLRVDNLLQFFGGIIPWKYSFIVSSMQHR